MLWGLFGKNAALRADPALLKAFMDLLREDPDLLDPRVVIGPRSLADIEVRLGLAPVVFVWGEDRGAGSFAVSVNGKSIEHLLEGLIPRSDPRFGEVRDAAMEALSETSSEAMIKACSAVGCMPSDAFQHVYL